MPAPQPSSFSVNAIAIAGVGLMGGAIAMAARRTGAATRIVGLGRNRERMEAARRAGIIDDAASTPEELAGVEFVVVCTPVDRIVDDVRTIAAVVGERAVITDAGSVKSAICEALSDLPHFVGSHPLAGSEKRGFEHAEEVELTGRRCVVTPLASTSERVTVAVESFWRTLGMDVTRLSPDEHDSALARTSHFPHLAAYALAALLDEADARFAASGFRDATRIAASDPALWTPILLMNRDAVRKAMKVHLETLQTLDRLLESGDIVALQALLSASREKRLQIDR